MENYLDERWFSFARKLIIGISIFCFIVVVVPFTLCAKLLSMAWSKMMQLLKRGKNNTAQLVETSEQICTQAEHTPLLRS